MRFYFYTTKGVFNIELLGLFIFAVKGNDALKYNLSVLIKLAYFSLISRILVQNKLFKNAK